MLFVLGWAGAWALAPYAGVPAGIAEAAGVPPTPTALGSQAL